MPSNKTFIIIILCLAGVVSFWLITRKAPDNSALLNGTSGTSVSVVKPNNLVSADANDDWRKTFVTVDVKDNNVIDLTKNNTDTDTTLTAQMSRDFMAQYLVLKQSGKDITQADIDAITRNVLSLPAYTSSSGAIYVASNLRVINQNDSATIKKYKEVVNLVLKNRSMQVTEGPVSLLNKAAQADSSLAYTRLGDLAKVAHGLIDDLLAISVPKDAVTVHLEVLNATSNMLDSLDAMSQASSDPVKGLVGTSQYNQNMLNFQNALTDMSNYFVRKTGSAT